MMKKPDAARLRRKFAQARINAEVLHEIQALLDGAVWTPLTLDDVADVMRDNGFQIRDPSEMKVRAPKKARRTTKR